MKDEKILTQNPTIEMRLPREEKRLPRHAFTEEEVEAIMAQPDLSTPTGLRLRALMTLCPPFVLIRARKPCTRCRRLFLG